MVLPTSYFSAMVSTSVSILLTVEGATSFTYENMKYQFFSEPTLLKRDILMMLLQTFLINIPPPRS